MAHAPRNETSPTHLIVVAALAVLAILVYVVWAAEASRQAERRRRAETLAEIRRLGKALQQYAEELEERYPGSVGRDESGNVGWSRSLDLLFPSYTSGSRRYLPPSAKDADNLQDNAAGEQDKESAAPRGEDEAGTTDEEAAEEPED